MPEPEQRKWIAEMYAEWLREASVLIAVFGWLDKRVQGQPFSGAWAMEVLGAALFAFILGVAVERTRRPK